MSWNINRRLGFENTLSEIVNKEGIDILLLEEAMNIDDNLLAANTNLVRINSPIPSDQIDLTPRFYSSNRGFTLNHYHTVQNTKRLVFCFLEIPDEPIILLAGIHFPSKLNYDGETQRDIANSYVNWLINVEDANRRTIVFGDFNMNPFELGMIGPKTFNATLSKTIATVGSRTFQNDQFNYFYNPMWNFMGDINYITGAHKLPGSYYHHKTTDSKIIYWNVIDKVICRPEALEYLDLPSIEFLTASGIHQLVKITPQGEYQINSALYSDHLPLIFNIQN